MEIICAGIRLSLMLQQHRGGAHTTFMPRVFYFCLSSMIRRKLEFSRTIGNTVAELLSAIHFPIHCVSIYKSTQFETIMWAALFVQRKNFPKRRADNEQEFIVFVIYLFRRFNYVLLCAGTTGNKLRDVF